MEGIVNTDLVPTVEESEITSDGTMKLEPIERMHFDWSGFNEPSLPRRMYPYTSGGGNDKTPIEWMDSGSDTSSGEDGSAINALSVPRSSAGGAWDSGPDTSSAEDGSVINAPSVPRSSAGGAWDSGPDTSSAEDGSVINAPSVPRSSAGANSIARATVSDSRLDTSGGKDGGAPSKGKGSKSFSTNRRGDGSTSSCPWSLTYEQQVHNLKENWKKALDWGMASIFVSSRFEHVKIFETSPWFASVVAQLRADPCWNSCKFETDQSPLGKFVTGVKMTSLDLAILMGDCRMVRKILLKIFKRCISVNDEIICGPLMDRKKALELSSSLGISLNLKKTCFIYTPLHLAVQGGDSRIVSVLLHYGADANARNWQGQTPLDCAYKMENITILQQLFKKDISRKDLLHLVMLHQDVYSKRELPNSPNVNVLDSSGRTPLHYLATRHSLGFDVMKNIVHYLAQDRTLDVKALDSRGFSAFYVAVLYCNTGLVIALLDSFKDQIRLNEACNQELGPPIQIAFGGGDSFKDIERALMECEPIKGYMERLYRDRQVYVDAANAILVGAALIASVTFDSWLQPPLNYTSYFGDGYASLVPAPASSDVNYVDVQYNIRLRAFWVLNALSFYFSIATVVCGARTVLPRSHLFIKKTVEKLCTNLLVTSILLACSVLFVLIAFAIAGTIVLTPMLKYQWFMIVPTMVGGMVCIISLVFLIKSMKEIYSNTRENCKLFNIIREDYL